MNHVKCRWLKFQKILSWVRQQQKIDEHGFQKGYLKVLYVHSVGESSWAHSRKMKPFVFEFDL